MLLQLPFYKINKCFLNVLMKGFFSFFSLSLQIVLPPHLENIRDKLAENIHELWGMNKIELGWTYGKVNLL